MQLEILHQTLKPRIYYEKELCFNHDNIKSKPIFLLIFVKLKYK